MDCDQEQFDLCKKLKDALTKKDRKEKSIKRIARLHELKFL